MLSKGSIHAVPILHYNMETAAEVRKAFLQLQPDCVAVELPETWSLECLHGASRLPDLSVIVADSSLYLMVEPCEGTFEGLRSAQEAGIPAFCIDFDGGHYPLHRDLLPDPYAITRLGLHKYYALVKSYIPPPNPEDTVRELYMARRLKELSLRYETVLFVGGMFHVQRVLDYVSQNTFPTPTPVDRERVLATLTEKSVREVMAEYGWLTLQYEEHRTGVDRQKMLLRLYKESSTELKGYDVRNLMKFSRNYALATGQLAPNFYQILSAAKGCVDHNFAYDVWEKATTYPPLRNVDGLPALDLTLEQVWGNSKMLKFHLKLPHRKGLNFDKKRKKGAQDRLEPPNPFSLCSYPPEDIAIEGFGEFLKKKGVQVLAEEGVRTIPFSGSLEDGIDVKETLRHFTEKQLYVRVSGRPPSGVGSIVLIFDDKENDYPWEMTWLGEHSQESDMALYATSPLDNVVGPGICQARYGGLLLSSPPRRMQAVWDDPDYEGCESKAEVLLMAGIDYAVKPVIVYVAAKPPRPLFKKVAAAYGKKIAYIPIGQLSALRLERLRTFHILDSQSRRNGADEYIR